MEGGVFSGRFSGSFSCKYPGVSGRDVNRRMVWGVGGRILTFYDKLMKLHNGAGHKIKIYIKKVKIYNHFSVNLLIKKLDFLKYLLEISSTYVRWDFLKHLLKILSGPDDVKISTLKTPTLIINKDSHQSYRLIVIQRRMRGQRSQPQRTPG